MQDVAKDCMCGEDTGFFSSGKRSRGEGIRDVYVDGDREQKNTKVRKRPLRSF